MNSMPREHKVPLSHIIIKSVKTCGKDKILKAGRKISILYTKKQHIRSIANFSLETVQIEENRAESLQYWRKKPKTNLLTYNSLLSKITLKAK